MIQIQVLQLTHTELQDLIIKEVTKEVTKAIENLNSLQAKKQLLSRKEYAKQLNVNISTLWRWEQTGELIPVRKGSKIFYEV